MKQYDYLDLGATLFVPATHKNLFHILKREKLKNLKSIVIDTEDALLKTEVDSALNTIKNLLKKFQKNTLLVFIRVRDSKTLQTLLTFENITLIDGFVLPKFSLSNAHHYLTLLQNTHFKIMPSIEGSELFNILELIKLKDILTKQTNILLVRFGLEDMLQQLAMTRDCNISPFDISVTNTILGNFLAVFKGAGFSVSGGVYSCYTNEFGYQQDIQRDFKEGLFSKTIIHPKQIEPLHNLYKVSQTQYNDATYILQQQNALSSKNGRMIEKSVHTTYAKSILKRAEIYGFK